MTLVTGFWSIAVWRFGHNQAGCWCLLADWWTLCCRAPYRSAWDCLISQSPWVNSRCTTSPTTTCACVRMRVGAEGLHRQQLKSTRVGPRTTCTRTHACDTMWNSGSGNPIWCAGYIRPRVRVGSRTCPHIILFVSYLFIYFFWWYVGLNSGPRAW
jgi:hypothetical protein